MHTFPYQAAQWRGWGILWREDYWVVSYNLTVAGTTVISPIWTYGAKEGYVGNLSSLGGFLPKSHAGMMRELLSSFSKADMMQ